MSATPSRDSWLVNSNNNNHRDSYAHCPLEPFHVNDSNYVNSTVEAIVRTQQGMELTCWAACCVICQLFPVLPLLIFKGQSEITLHNLYCWATPRDGEEKWQWCHLWARKLNCRKGKSSRTHLHLPLTMNNVPNSDNSAHLRSVEGSAARSADHHACAAWVKNKLILSHRNLGAICYQNITRASWQIQAHST